MTTRETEAEAITRNLFEGLQRERELRKKYNMPASPTPLENAIGDVIDEYERGFSEDLTRWTETLTIMSRAELYDEISWVRQFLDQVEAAMNDVK